MSEIHVVKDHGGYKVWLETDISNFWLFVGCGRTEPDALAEAFRILTQAAVDVQFRLAAPKG